MDAGFEARLHAGDVSFDARDAALLRAIAERGSLNAAAEDLGRGYSRAHKRLSALEASFGPLVERRRGGPDGGGSRLTDDARDVLARFDRLRAALAGTADVAETVFEGRVLERDGALATVETAAGTVRAVLPRGGRDDGEAGRDGERVQVTLRADAVTLHAPDAAPPAGGTSARNRFEGDLVAADVDGGLVRVAVDVGAATPLRVLVTEESRERLALRAGAPVVATCKATATRATPLA